ncbi:HK97 family phage prohead protease [Bradyrhizobium sp. AZCC 1719]|uniref:HK97 family phage prohead protease n=1 Tax=Bradyrhizobium sp. AZCC 1719 TaxID=3117028 RepID=UPI002FF28891
MSTDYQHSIPLAVKFSSSSQAGEFSGYASTFGGQPDAYGDIIAPGAFTKTITQHKAAGTSPALLWSHDMSQPIGVITKLVEDAHGLFMEGRLTLEVNRAAEAYALMKAGALAFSIGYQVSAATSLGKRERRLDEIKLYEVSCVAVPANTNAKLVSIKAKPDIFDQNSPRVIEQILRGNGVSRRHAKRIVALAKDAFEERDVLIAKQSLSTKLLAAAQAIENLH